MNSNEPPPLQPASDTAPSQPARRLNWLLFALALFTPTVLTILLTMAGGQKGGAAVGMALVGGGISGVVCGGMLGWRLGSTPQRRITLGILLACVLVVACVGMNCMGCLASGYRLDFK